MAFMPATQTTSIATHNSEDIFIRGKSLCRDLIGKLTFTEMLFFQILGRAPAKEQTTVVDACLVTLMEHGLTPSALAARLIYSSATEAMQGAVAAGLLGVGSLFVGTMEGCAVLLERMLAAQDGADAEAKRIVAEFRRDKKSIPGFGHPEHKPDDPRTLRVFAVARENGLAGKHIAAVQTLGQAVDLAFGRHITINATGAIAAALGDCGVPAEIMRGFALICRCAGLVGHIHEEQHKPAMRAIWETSEHAVKYDGTVG
jgi:citrate synthase